MMHNDSSLAARDSWLFRVHISDTARAPTPRDAENTKRRNDAQFLFASHEQASSRDRRLHDQTPTIRKLLAHYSIVVVCCVHWFYAIHWSSHTRKPLAILLLLQAGIFFRRKRLNQFPLSITCARAPAIMHILRGFSFARFAKCVPTLRALSNGNKIANIFVFFFFWKTDACA